jgi:hypothetical protein
MGNSISKRTLIPSSLAACINNEGNFSTELYFMYARGQKVQISIEELDEILDKCVASSRNDDDDEDVNDDNKRQIRNRGCY